MSHPKIAGFNQLAETLESIRKGKQKPERDADTASPLLDSEALRQKLDEWAGITGEEFLKAISPERAKIMLQQGRKMLRTGQSQPLLKIIGMTPTESRDPRLEIRYSLPEGPFGRMIVASTQTGICYMGPIDERKDPLEELRKRFPFALLQNRKETIHEEALRLFTQQQTRQTPLSLHLKGTEFQLKVWKALLEIPMGQLVAYGDIAERIGHPKACRAVGSAVGDNPIFFLVPCHRVIQASGEWGNYYWGTPVKTAIIGWESAGRIQE